LTEKLNVLATIKMNAEAKSRIEGVSPRIRLIDASDLARAEQEGDASAQEKLTALLAEADVIYGLRLPKDVVARSPKLKWIQVMAAGVDRYLTDEVKNSPVVVTSVSGIHATPIGEFVLGLMLMFAKQSYLCFQLKQQRKWKPFSPGMLRGHTVGVIGLGSIGREVARLSKALGMRVLAVRRSVKSAKRTRNVDVLFGPEGMPELLAESDYVVLALPLTSATRQIIGEKELRGMKPTACLINIARGNVVDEKALIRALKEGWIAGVGLDVFAQEPLPFESPLWDLLNVIMSPHVAGGMEDYVDRTNDVFCHNLERYLNGQKLINVVNKKLGY